MATDLKPDILFTESPASWNTRYVTPEGYICQITLRGENGKDLLEKAGIAMAYLAEHNYLPDPGFRKNGSGNGGNIGNGSDTKICPVHNCEMKKKIYPEECITREDTSNHVGEENISKAERRIRKEVRNL